MQQQFYPGASKAATRPTRDPGTLQSLPVTALEAKTAQNHAYIRGFIIVFHNTMMTV